MENILRIEICPKDRLMIEVTGVTVEMRRDIQECWNMTGYEKIPKDCSFCSWHRRDITCGIPSCEIITERGRKKGRIIWED